MIYNFRNTKIFYRFFNKKTDVANVYLHGWGCDGKSLLFCQDFVKDKSSLFIDFPPFGESENKIDDWTVFTYANMVISLCQHLGIKKFNLIGHSFGGRISIIMAVLCKKETNKVVLVDSAGVKPRRSLSYFLRVFVYKFKKRFGFDVSNCGSCDYLALDKSMRKIFNNIVNTHLDDFLPFVEAPTLIVFGSDDKVTPVYMAKKLKKKIKNSKLVLLEDAGHFCFIDRRTEFVCQLEEFLK